jgi:hypothetical protein
MIDFRPCLICQSYSQASLYHYALQPLLNGLSLPLYASVTF